MSKQEAPPGFRVIGVLGGIGSGKSTAARFIAEALDCPHLDADSAVSDLFQRAETLSALEFALNDSLRDENGALDRSKLSARIFKDPSARRDVEAILHPGVRRHLHHGLRLAETGTETNLNGEKQQATWAVLDVPLLLEGGLDAACDFLVFVSTPAELRSSRACERHGWSKDEWASREAAQFTISDKETRADVILHNSGTLDSLREQATALFPLLCDLPPRPLSERWPLPDEAPVNRKA
ncbi:MAG: dephospho-CoA kinase [Planctomycetes bacterium]|jgi:dephospho-CoA kinase|nr:dephospho-CoA kinase [Planctomycetota bacterium]MBT5101780.1 dephospho-CoA kinase [Planctomycetota bacterium]MBT5120483.1 dephospho-CoA kinase [Planctomycetota bacterium]